MTSPTTLSNIDIQLRFPNLDDMGQDAKFIRSWVLNKLYQVQGKSYVNKCLEKSQQDFSTANELQAQEEAQYILYGNYAKNAEGQIEVINQELLKKQKTVLSHMVKEFGSAILSGKSIMSISLPVGIFEARSQIEREAHNLLYAPYFLGKASKIDDTLEQFKFTVTHFIASMHVTVNPQKPFNPILGETFQGMIGDCPVYGEQISHHPPITAIQLLGKGFKVEGSTEFSASLAMNSVKSKKVGLLKVSYEGTGALVRVQYPANVMNGTSMGKRTFNFTGKFYIFDLENRYYCEVDFDNTESTSFFKKLVQSSTGPQDAFTGGIWQIKDSFAEKLRQQTLKFQELDFKFKEKDHAVTKLETIRGNWMESLYFNDQMYWSIGLPWPNKLQFIDNPLPSDANFRLDVLYLRIKDEIKAQEYKKIIEETQRGDQRLRDQEKNKSKK